VDEVRRQLAVRYIESPRLSITEIAFLLGYEDVSSFRRAFKKWTGKSPTQVRHDLR
jgi:AraC-like DNA-binding protein